MGPVSITRLLFPDMGAATAAARHLRSAGVRVEAVNQLGPGQGDDVAVLIRSSDVERAEEALADSGEIPIAGETPTE